MNRAREYTHEPTESRRHGLPPIGFRVVLGDAITIAPAEPIDAAAVLLHGEQRRGDDRLVGTIELGVFAARLMIDRDGTLARLVTVAAEHAITAPFTGRIESVHPVELAGGAIGACAELILTRDEHGQARPALPYLDLYAVTSETELAGGVFVTCHHAAPEWPAGRAMLDTLQILASRGGGTRSERGASGLPVVGRG
jgi:hypothetical protein